MVISRISNIGLLVLFRIAVKRAAPNMGWSAGIAWAYQAAIS